MSERKQTPFVVAGFGLVCLLGLGLLVPGSDPEPPRLGPGFSLAVPEGQPSVEDHADHDPAVGSTAAPARAHDDCGGQCTASSTVLGLDEMTRYAHRIVLGKVVGAEARRGEGEDAHLIFTHYTLEVLQPIKGTQAKTVSVRVLGGALPEEGVATHASHQPQPVLGQRAIVFIEDDPRLYTSVLGNLQGYLELDGDGVRDGFGRPIVGVGADARLRVGKGASLTPDALVREIRRLKQA